MDPSGGGRHSGLNGGSNGHDETANGHDATANGHSQTEATTADPRETQADTTGSSNASKEKEGDSEDEDEKTEGELASERENHEIEGESEEASESSEEEDEEEEPPLLRYSRLNQLPPNFFKTDPVSAAYFHENVFLFGTHTGVVLLTSPDLTTIRTFKAQKASVLSLHTNGDYFACGSLDGTVVIGSITDAKDIVMFDFKRPIHAVVLDKNYSQSRTFYCGGMAGTVIQSSKTWLDRRVDAILDQDNGPIVGLHIVDDVLFWMNDAGITAYHITTRKTLTKIEKPEDATRSDLYWPRVSLYEVDRMLIAWGNYIWSIRIHSATQAPTSGAGTSIRSRVFWTAADTKTIKVESFFKMDFLISGIASFKNEQWAVLTYNPPIKDEETGVAVHQNPDLLIVNAFDGTTVREEELELQSTKNLGLNDYNLHYHIGPTAARYFVISARDGVIAEQVQLNQQLLWYLDRQMYSKAWSMSEHLLSLSERLRVGLQHVDYLVKHDDWDSAASWLDKLLNIDTSDLPLGDGRSTFNAATSVNLHCEEQDTYLKELALQWNLWGDIFTRSGHEKLLTKIIPTDPRWNLDRLIFSQIIQFWLERENTDDEIYRVLVNFDLELYNAEEIFGTIESILELDPANDRLRSELCRLYLKAHELEKAVPHLLKMRSPHIVSFLHENHKLSSFSSEIPSFVRLQLTKGLDLQKTSILDLRDVFWPTVEILVEYRHEIFPKNIVEMLSENGLEIVSYFYLEKLTSIDDLFLGEFEDVRINLYSQFDRPKLLPFLMNNDGYDIASAIKICEHNAFVDELIFLLGKAGENERALFLIMDELDDPVRAINFAKSQNDAATWSTLLSYSYQKPHFIKALIELGDEQSSRFYNPMTILQNMVTDVHIDGLKDSITRMSYDNSLNVIVSQLVLKIAYKRSDEISKLFYMEKLKGILVEGEAAQRKALEDMFQSLVILLSPESGPTPRIEFARDIETQHDCQAYTTFQLKLEHFGRVERAFKSNWNK